MSLAELPCTLDPSSVLRAYWGYEQFRDPQDQVVQSLLQGKDTLALLPTGAGKSVCFQLPAVMQPGLTVVLTPLVSLMENQVQDLCDRHVEAIAIHGQQSSYERRRRLDQVTNGSVKLLYLSPESFLSESVWKRLLGIRSPLNYLIVDEAHCVSQWGTTFRPIYRRLGAARQALQQHWNCPVPIGAFTATANPQMQRDIMQVLQLYQPTVIRRSPYRSNLDLQVAIAWTPRGRCLKLLHFIQRQGHQSGLIYTRSRRDSESLADWFKERGFQTRAYHAGLLAAERREIEQAWLTGQLQFVICTCAFGMGINKPNVRWIAHYQPPLTLNEYVQEIGRAGRDGLRSQVLMLVSEPTGWLDGQDRQQRQYFVSQIQGQLRQANSLMKRLPQQGYIPDIAKVFPHAEMSLSLLHSLGVLDWVDPLNYVLRQRRLPRTDGISMQSIEMMDQFLHRKDCRWQLILRAFGFLNGMDRQECGHCDRCQKRMA